MTGEEIEEIANYRSALKDALGNMIPPEGDLRVWLDDDLIERRAPEGWVHLRTAREVCLILLTGRVVELSLDNDLGDSRETDDDGAFIVDEDDPRLPGEIEFGVGYQVIDFLEELHGSSGEAPWPREGISLHTSNVSARDGMSKAIENLARMEGVEVESSLNERSQPRFRITLPGGEQ